MHFCDNFYKISKSTFFLQSTLGRFSRKMNLQERYVNVQKLDFVISSSYFFFFYQGSSYLSEIISKRNR